MPVHGEHAATGAAKRRRERRLRQWQRHERMTVAMAVAEATHHSAPRRQKTATAIWEEVEQDTYDAEYYGHRTLHLRGRGRESCRIPGRRVSRQSRSVTWMAGAPSLTVVLVSDMMHDDVTVQFLLQQSLLPRAQD